MPYTLTRAAIAAEFSEEQLQDLITALIREEFQPYLTSVGGSGLGILSPYAVHRTPGVPPAPQALGQVTPPDTPTPHEQIVGGAAAPGADDLARDPLRAPFLAAPGAELAQWAGALGRWLYV